MNNKQNWVYASSQTLIIQLHRYVGCKGRDVSKCILGLIIIITFYAQKNLLINTQHFTNLNKEFALPLSKYLTDTTMYSMIVVTVKTMI